MKEFIATESTRKQETEQHATCMTAAVCCVSVRGYRSHPQEIACTVGRCNTTFGVTVSLEEGTPAQHTHTVEWEILGSDRTTNEPNRAVNCKSFVQNYQLSPNTSAHVNYKITHISYRYYLLVTSYRSTLCQLRSVMYFHKYDG